MSSGNDEAAEGVKPEFSSPALAISQAPWGSIQENEHYLTITDATGFGIAEVELTDDGKGRANARLIEAAPKLLARLLERCPGCRDGKGFAASGYHGFDYGYCHLMKEDLEVLAAIRGEAVAS